MQMRTHMRGITLIELMIVVVVVRILAAIAYPNYQEFVGTRQAQRGPSGLAATRNQSGTLLPEQQHVHAGYDADLGFRQPVHD